MVRTSITFTRQGQSKIRKRLLQEGLRISQLAKQNLTRNGTVDTGQLRQSIQVQENLDDFSVTVGSTLRYADTIEFGRIPEQTRREDIKQWAERKLGLSEPELSPATTRIVRKIRREGVEEQPYMRPAIQRYISQQQQQQQ